MQQLKLKPFLITFIIAIVVFVTAGFTYQYVAKTKPLDQAMAHLQFSTVTTTFDDNKENIYIEMTPNSNADFQEAVQEVYSILKPYQYGNDNIHISVQSNTETSLDQLWKDQLFNIAEAMAAQNYSKIPELMTSLEKQYSELDAQADIDNQFVYITLKEGQDAKYVLLPLTVLNMEAWNNA